MIQTAVETAPAAPIVVQGLALDASGNAIPAPPLTVRQKSMAVQQAKNGPVRTKVSTNLDDYEEVDIKQALKDSRGGSIQVRMNVERARYLAITFGASWNSEFDMGATSKDDLTDMHRQALSQHIRTKSLQFISMIKNSCAHSAKDRTRDSEQLRLITCKSEYNNHSDLGWVALLDSVWLHPAVRL